MRKVWLVAGFTLREALHHRTIQVLLGMAVLLVVLFGFGAAVAWESIQLKSSPLMSRALAYASARMLMAVLNILATIAMIFVAAGSIQPEVESGSLHVLLPRTITRPQVYLGKLVAVVALAVGFSLVLVLGVGVALWAAGPGWPPGYSWTLLFPVTPVLLGLLALALSTRLRAIAAGLLSLTAFVLAQVGSMIESMAMVSKSQVMESVGIAISLVTPADAVYRWMIDQWATYMGPIGAAFRTQEMFGLSVPSVWMLCWAAGWAAVVIWAGMCAFSSQDL